MAAVRLLLVLFCTLPVYGSRLPDGDLLKIAAKEIGVREKSGQNDGDRVETYLAYVGLKKGNPWCAAFVSWVFWKAGYKEPRSGWSPALFPTARRIAEPRPGAVLGIFFPELKRIGHVGLVLALRHDWVESVEGNTNVQGSREGDGVYRKLRHKRFVRAYSNWWKNPGIKDSAGMK